MLNTSSLTEHTHTKILRQFKFGDKVSISKDAPLCPTFDLFIVFTGKFVLRKNLSRKK
jgi:hypothetical protein